MKLLKVGIALLLVCSIITGCSKKNLSEDEMKSLIQETNANMNAVDNAHMTMNTKINMSSTMVDDRAEVSFTADMQYKDLNKATMGLSGHFTMGMSGVSMEGQLYICDGVMYINFLSNKMKMPLDLSKTSMVNAPFNVDVSLLKNWSYEKKGGMTIIDCDLDSSSFESILKDLDVDSTTFTLNQLHCCYGITKDKYLSYILIDMDLKTSIDGQDLAYVGQIEINFDEFNQISEIIYPDLNNYLEMTDDNELFN